MRLLRLALVVAAVLNPSVIHAQEWKYSKDANGLHAAEVSSNGKTPDQEATTTLRLYCRKGFAGISYSVHGISRIKSFDFADFEGPNAPASSELLVKVAVRLKKRTINLNLRAAGQLSMETDTFEFILAHSDDPKSDFNKLIRAINGSGSSIAVTVQSYKDRTKTIYTEFPLKAASMTIEKALKECDLKKLT